MGAEEREDSVMDTEAVISSEDNPSAEVSSFSVLTNLMLCNLQLWMASVPQLWVAWMQRRNRLWLRLAAMDTTFDAPQGEGSMEDLNIAVEDTTDAVDVAVQGEAPTNDSSLEDIGEESAGFNQSERAPSDDDSSLGG